MRLIAWFNGGNLEMVCILPFWLVSPWAQNHIPGIGKRS
jgi:hypothetical protein